MPKCDTCTHKRTCIDGVDYRYAAKCIASPRQELSTTTMCTAVTGSLQFAYLIYRHLGLNIPVSDWWG